MIRLASPLCLKFQRLHFFSTCRNFVYFVLLFKCMPLTQNIRRNVGMKLGLIFQPPASKEMVLRFWSRASEMAQLVKAPAPKPDGLG